MWWDITYKIARRRRIKVLLVHHYFKKLACKRQPGSKRLVEHHAYAVPIAGAGNGKLSALLRRHVIGRAGQGDAFVKFLAFDFGDQAEIKNDDSAFLRNQYIRGLDVAMKLSHFVQGKQPLDQLPESDMQTIK